MEAEKTCLDIVGYSKHVTNSLNHNTRAETPTRLPPSPKEIWK